MYKITITDDYFVEVDALNYTLKHKYTISKGINKGNEKEEILGYFGTLEQALRKCSKDILDNRLDGATISLDGYINRLESDFRDFMRIIKLRVEEVVPHE